MKKYLWGIIAILVLMIGIFIYNRYFKEEELYFLEVDFDVPETAEVGETVTLKATVTYGNKPVKDARQMDFEVWERGKQDESIWLEGENQGDGTYTAEVTFEKDGIYEMYAHTTAHDLHTMPKKEIIVGEGGDYDDVEEHAFHTEGFDMGFISDLKTEVNKPTDLSVQIFLNEEPLENLNVQFEIWNDEISDEHDWVPAEERDNGTYEAQYIFNEAGDYEIQVHVEDDDDLHEHIIYTMEVSE